MNDSIRVLVVEDSSDLRELLCLQLQFGGYEAICADNGAAALGMVDEVDPAILLTDVLMPGLRGTELARTLRERPRFQDLPIILYTGINADDEDLVAATALPLVCCVSKGAPMRALLGAIASLLEARRSTPI